MTERTTPSDDEVAAIAAATPYDPEGKFTWEDGDIEILEMGPDGWDLSYEDNGATILVQEVNGLMQHFLQGGQDDLQSALDSFMADNPKAPNMPVNLLNELLSLGVIELPAWVPPTVLPRRAPEARRMGDGTARGGYGVEVFERDSYRCAYCLFDLGATYRRWLQLSVDHVVPAQMTSAGYPAEWIHDTTNLVTCCRSCNDFSNRDRIDDPAPATHEEFLLLRDRVFGDRRRRLAARHRAERARYRTLVPPDVIGRTGDPA